MIDNENEKILENVKLKISISNFDEEENLEMKKSNRSMLKIATVACCMLIVTTSLVFAKDISNFVSKIFNNSNKAIDAAIENGYVQTEEMEYIYDKDIGVKLDSLVLDDLNLNISFNFETKRENIKSIRFENFNITNDNDKVVFRSEFEYSETLEELPLYNFLNWGNEPIKLSETAFTDSILLGLRPEREDFKELYFDINTIQITYMDDKIDTIEGNWDFKVTISNEMRKSTNIIYNMSENNEYIESCTLTMANTGAIIEFKSKEKIPMETYEKEGVFTGELVYLKNNEKIYKPSWMEYNEDGMEIHFEDIGAFIENSDTLNLHLDFLDTVITLVKK